MKIIILGAGEVGGSLARILAEEGNEITLVDENPQFLERYKRGVDLRTIAGCASYPNVLEMAEAGDADMLVALTRDDEVNMMACQIAHTMFHVPTKIARIRSNAYRQHKNLFDLNHIPVDVTICPEEQLTKTITKLIKYPNSLRVVEFAEGHLLMAATHVEAGSSMAGKQLSDIPKILGDIDASIVAIFRENDEKQILNPKGDERFLPKDIVFFVAMEHSLRVLMVGLSNIEKPYKHIFIAGGGRVGKLLAKKLSDDYFVKIIDRDANKNQILAGSLENVVVLQGSITDTEIMVEENIDKMDVFCAVTNNDESNIIAGMLAKNLGVRKAMVLISRNEYHKIAQQTNIDIAFSPQQDTVGTILQYIRKGDVVKAYSLHKGKSEAIEIVVHGDEKSSRVVGRTLDDLHLPKSVAIAAIVRDGQPIIIKSQLLRIESNDHIVLFLSDKAHLHDIERLFQVKVGFF
ncbi:MAG: Trk system potassium transporter TrkA [Candidatus Oxydemutatoraceae bacterium WSBS_2016_MAG_OTU14]